jgi:hypothetical protein
MGRRILSTLHSDVMRWKIWIMALLTFVGICVLADVTVTYALRSPLSDSDRIRHLYHENGDEIPIFGASKAHGHYNPRVMGLKAFNYGIDGASYEVTDVLLQIELAKPKTTPIIIELQHRDTGQLTDTGKFIPFVSDPRIRQLLNRFHEMDWKYYIPGIRYFGHYDSYIKDYLWLHLHMSKVSNGFSEHAHPLVFNRAKLDQHVRERLKYTNGYFQDEDQERRLLAHITEHPQRLFFLVVSPYHPSYYVRFQNAEKFVAFKARLAAQPNVILLDWGQLDYPDEFFGDTLHLQWEAAEKFSRTVGERIRQELRERSERASAGGTQSK